VRIVWWINCRARLELLKLWTWLCLRMCAVEVVNVAFIHWAFTIQINCDLTDAGIHLGWCSISPICFAQHSTQLGPHPTETWAVPKTGAGLPKFLWCNLWLDKCKCNYKLLIVVWKYNSFCTLWWLFGGKRNACKVLVGKPEGYKLLLRPRHRLEDNI